MASTTKRTRVPPERRASLDGPYTPGGPAILTLTIGREQLGYFLYRLTSDFGRCFRLEKFRTQGEEVYDISLDLEHRRHGCECKGWLRWNRCKHVAALLELVNRGLL